MTALAALLGLLAPWEEACGALRSSKQKGRTQITR